MALTILGMVSIGHRCTPYRHAPKWVGGHAPGFAPAALPLTTSESAYRVNGAASVAGNMARAPSGERGNNHEQVGDAVTGRQKQIIESTHID
jgi:hypothetical protein